MKNTLQTILSLSNLHSKLTGTPENPDFIQQIKTWGAGIFRVVVMGEIKKGKSSFINALLGRENLVPTASDIATSTVYKIRYGKENAYRVFFNESTGIQPAIISAEEVAAYGTEAGNPGNEKQVDFIEVICDADILKGGLVIIDTPGLGGTFKEHKKVTWKHVPKADAVFFVTDSIESPIGQKEIELLKKVLSITPHICFVQSKTDTVSSSHAEMRKNNNLGILAENLNLEKSQIPYFPISSVLKEDANEDNDMELLQLSGYPALMSYVHNILIANKQKILRDQAICRTMPLLQEVKQAFSNRNSILLADTAQKQQEIKDAFEKAQKEIRNWEQVELPARRKQISRGFEALQNECENVCRTHLRPEGTLQTQYQAQIDASPDVETLSIRIQKIHGNLQQAASSGMLAVQKHFQEGVTTLLPAVFEQHGQDTSITLVAAPGTGANMTHVLARIKHMFGACNNARDHIANGLLGGNIGGMIGANVLGLIIPGIGHVVGGIVGGVIGGIWMNNQAQHTKHNQTLQTAKNIARGEVQRSISSLYCDMLNAIKNLTNHYTNLISDTLDNEITAKKRELEESMNQLKERSRLEQNKLAERKQELARDKSMIDAIEKELKSH